MFDIHKTIMIVLLCGEKNYNNILSRFRRIPERNGQTGGRTDRIAISISRVSVEETGRGRSPPRPLLAVPNVTAHSSTASVPITVLLYYGPLLCGFNVAIKGLNVQNRRDVAIKGSNK